MSEERYYKADTAAWIGISGNAALALVKGAAGWMAGSKALLADALFSASAAAGSFAKLIGKRASKVNPEADRMQERGKAETVASVIVSVLMLIVGVEIGISAIKSLYNGVDSPPEGYSLMVILASIVAKEAIFQYKYRIAKRLSSQSLVADAWTHRGHLYPSLAALGGAGGAMLGGILGLPYFYYLDPLGGLIVSIFILKMGFDTIMEALRISMDRTLHHEDAQDVMQAVQRVKGVITVDELTAREQGHYVVVEMKISVNPRITVFEGHEIAKDVKGRLMERYIHISDVLVHVYPYDPGYPYKNNLELEQRDFPSMLQ